MYIALCAINIQYFKKIEIYKLQLIYTVRYNLHFAITGIIIEINIDVKNYIYAL